MRTETPGFAARKFTLLAITTLCAVLFLLLSGPAQSQSNPFAPAIKVGNRVLTNFDLQQRTLFLTLLNAGPNADELAREQLVTETLQFMAADRDGVTIPEEAIIEAQADFASQGNFELDQFIQALGQQGVEENTFRNFVSANIIWRETVRNRFSERVMVTPEDVDRALATTPAEAGTRVNISEIILPADDPLSEAASIARANEIRQSTDEDDFANAARLFSISPSRFQGGDVGWRPVEVLPEAAAAEIVRLSPGQITRPTPLLNTIAIFQLHDLERVPAGSIDVVSADYAMYLIPGGRSPRALAEANEIRREVRSCDDLYGVAQGQPENRLQREITQLNALPSDIARELQELDKYEVSTNLTRGGNLVFLMLCERTLRESAEVDREQVRVALLNQRLATYAQGYLNELRLATNIEFLR